MNNKNSSKSQNALLTDVNSLLEYYKSAQFNIAENLAIKLIKQFPNHLISWKVLAAVLLHLGRFQESLDANQRVIEISPTDPEAHNNLGGILKKIGRLNDAEFSFKKAIELNLNYAEAHSNLGNTMRELGRLKEAETSHREAIRIKPAFATAHSNLGNVLRELGKLEEATKSYWNAIGIKPDYAEAYCNLGVTLNELGRLREAETSFRKAIQIRPRYAEAYSNLGLHLNSRGLNQEANHCHQMSIEFDQASIALRWCLTMSQIAKVYSIKGESEKAISQFELELTKLDSFITPERLEQAVKLVGKVQPYHIAYLENNNKELLSKYGNICCRIMKFWQEKNKFSDDNLKLDSCSSKIKIGIISSHIRYHSVWNAFLKGIVTQINKDKFSLYIYYIDGLEDYETTIANKYSTRLIFGNKLLSEWFQTIAVDNLDVAFFPELGMNAKTLQLASMRLAKIQCTSWGHPETSGLPSIDYFISSELCESAYSASNYSEKLVCLDNLGCYFDPPSLEIEEIDLSQYGINVDLNLLLCLGVPNKFHPDNDYIFIEILKKIPECQLIFLKDDHEAYKIIEQRLILKINQNNLIADNKIIFIPNLSRNGFNTLMRAGKVLLDTIYFSGFNTPMQALGCGLPVVTLQGQFMRSRAATGILKRIHLEELIAKNSEMYIGLIYKLISDQEFYKEIKNKIKDNVGLLYRDTAPIRSLENFFTEVLMGGKN